MIWWSALIGVVGVLRIKSRNRPELQMWRVAAKCAVSMTAVALTFGLVGSSGFVAPTPASKVAAQTTLTAPFEQRSDSVKTLARGAKVYATSCQPCHGDKRGKGSIGRAHPLNESGHAWHHPDGQIREWILRGKPDQD